MIKMECLSPIRVRGERNFAGFEDFALWVVAEIRGGKSKVGRLLSPLAEMGELTVSSVGCDIHATSDFSITNYLEWDKLKRQTGLIKKRGFGDHYSKDPQVAMTFARELDKLAQGQEVSP